MPREARARPTHSPHIFRLTQGKADARVAKAMGMKNWKCIFSRISTCPARNVKENDFKKKVLQVRVKEHSIHDILNLTVDQAIVFFATSCPKVLKGLQRA